MGLLNIVFVAALASLPFALGQASTSTEQTCLTKLGPKSVSPIPSSTTTISSTTILTAVATSTPQVTIYPSTFTVTTTVISSVTVTASQITDTFSSTSTVIVDNTQTTTVTSTITSSFDTTITTVDTTTIPTSAGFQFPGTSVVAKRRAVRHEHRDRVKDSAADATRSKIIPPGETTTKNSPQRYPTSVICQETIDTLTTTTIVTTAATATQTASTPITTTTEVTTFTSTLLPADASTTLTFTDTVLTTDTEVVTSTETLSVTNVVTVTQPGPTVYAACAAANLIDSGEGDSINMITYLAAASESIVSASTPYDCCVACQNQALCGGTDFASGVCELIIASTCDATVSVAGYKADGSSGAPPPGSSNRFYVSNGNCGNVVYQGLDGVGL